MPNMPAPTLLDNAYTASNVAYDMEDRKANHEDPAKALPEGWKIAPHEKNDPKTSLLEKADAVELIAPNGQHFVAIAGSNKKGDLAPDAANFADMYSQKYEVAAELGEAYRNEGVIFTGHSLGGGMSKTAAATASVGRDAHGNNAKPATAIGFDSAPIGKFSRTLLDHNVDPAHLESETIQVINRYDPANRTPGGLLHYTGNAMPSSPNEVVVLAEGKGGYASPLVGHSITSLEDQSFPGRLTTALTVDGSMIDKAVFDRYSSAREAVRDPKEVTPTLQQAQSPQHQHVQSHGR
jgi:hypothetical protein